MNIKFAFRSLFVVCVALGFGRVATADDDKKDDKPLTDSTFVTKVATCGLAEVELGKAAQTNARNAEVKKFGDHMVKDHSAAIEELKTIAAGIPVALPERVDDPLQKDIDRIKNLTGAEFDKAYMEQMVKNHEKAVDLFTRAGKEVSNTRLKEFAKKTLPAIEEHLKHAKEIRDQLK